MFPTLPFDKLSNLTLGHSVFFGKRFNQGAIPSANGLHILIGQFRVWRQLARQTAIATSTLGVHITDIIAIRTKPKVVRSYARRIVTTMAHRHAFGDRAMMKGVGKAMGTHSLGEPTATILFSPFVLDVHDAVTFRQLVARPYPTLTRLVNAVPKTIDVCLRNIHRVTSVQLTDTHIITQAVCCMQEEQPCAS